MSFYRTFSISLGASQTGVPLIAQLIDYQGVVISSGNAGFIEIGQGCYGWHGLIPDNFEGFVKFINTSGLVFTGAFSSINKNDCQIVPYILGNVADAAPASGSFLGSTNLSAANNFYTGQYLAFIDPSGNLDGVPGKITNYVGSTKTFTFLPAFPVAPASGDRFIIIGRWQ